MSMRQCLYKSLEDVQSPSVSRQHENYNQMFVGTDCKCSSVGTESVRWCGQRVSVQVSAGQGSVRVSAGQESVQVSAGQESMHRCQSRDGTKTPMHSFGQVSPSWLCTPSRLGASAGGQSTKQGPPVIRIASNVYIGGKHCMFC